MTRDVADMRSQGWCENKKMKQQIITLTNNSNSDKTLLIEPWAEQFLLKANSSFNLLGQKEEDEANFFVQEIQYSDEAITLYANSDWLVNVLNNGEMVEPRFDLMD